MRAIAELFGGPVVVAASVLSLADDGLYPEERAYIQAAVAKRRAEFATARILARKALATLGAAPVALVPKPDRAPVWPSGYTGSISHCANYCAVAVARSSDVRSLGLDVEDLRELDRSMLDLVLTPGERRWLRAQPDALQPMLPIVIFSAKEAYYKCQYPITHGFLDFQDVELSIEWEAGRFEAQIRKEGWPAAVARLAGRLLVADGRVSCGVMLVQDGSPSAS
jgi:4'-phosphopantetheinyl transferase EntD